VRPPASILRAGPPVLLIRPFAVHGLDGVGFDGQFLIFGVPDRTAEIDNEGRLQIYAP
jgi:hypothetical protein